MNFTIDVNVNGLDELAKALRVVAVVMAEKHTKPSDPDKPTEPVEPNEAESVDDRSEEEIRSEEVATGDYRDVVASEDDQKEDLPWEPEKQEPEKSAIPAVKPEADTPAKTYDDVTNKAIELLDGGKQDALIGLLSKYGVQAIPDLPANKLDSFYADLEVL